MSGSQIEMLFVILYMSLFTLFLTADNNLTILLLSELIWITLYILYIIIGYFIESVVLLSIALPILILAATDCGLWILLMVGLNNCTKTIFSKNKNTTIKFFFRAQRLLYVNNFIL